MSSTYSKKLKYITDNAEEMSRLKAVTEFTRIGPITVCKIESDDRISMGVSICGLEDEFTKSAGRYWSARRALRAHVGRSLGKSLISKKGLEALEYAGIRVKHMVSAFVFRGDGKDEFHKFVNIITEQYQQGLLN